MEFEELSNLVINTFPLFIISLIIIGLWYYFYVWRPRQDKIRNFGMDDLPEFEDWYRVNISNDNADVELMMKSMKKHIAVKQIRVAEEMTGLEILKRFQEESQ